jgi:hypothetical protein
MNTVLIICAILGIAIGGLNILYEMWEVIQKKRFGGINIVTFIGAVVYILLAGHILGWW